MRRSGACPAAHMGLFWQFPGSIQGGGRTKTFPLGGRWPGEAGSDEGHSVEATTSARKPTFPPLISQKSKIFASFPRGGSLFLVQVRGVLFCCIRLGTYRRSSSGSPGGEPPSPGGDLVRWNCGDVLQKTHVVGGGMPPPYACMLSFSKLLSCIESGAPQSWWYIARVTGS